MIYNPVNPFSIGTFYDDADYGIKLHLRVQKRNAKKCITTVSGLSYKFQLDDMKSLIKHLKKILNCSGTIIREDNDIIFQFSGDQRNKLKQFFIDENIADDQSIIIHGY